MCLFGSIARDAAIRLEQARAQVEQQRQAVQQAEANADQAIANLAPDAGTAGRKGRRDLSDQGFLAGQVGYGAA